MKQGAILTKSRLLGGRIIWRLDGNQICSRLPENLLNRRIIRLLPVPHYGSTTVWYTYEAVLND